MKLVLGAPGTGKTTWLLKRIEEAIAAGIAPEDIGFISFTRKAVNEAKDRAITKFDFSPDRFPYFRTIHSLSFRQLGVKGQDMMARENYEELGERLGLEICCRQSVDGTAEDIAKGDKLLGMEALSRMTCRTLREQWEIDDQDIDWYELEYFAESLHAYKRSQCLHDFTDLLTKYEREGQVPSLRVLFVDEAQDLCRLQWRIVEKLCACADTVYIAGDDDQAIFKWAGADIDYFLNLHADKTILDTSYRLPEKIHAFSQEILGNISQRYTKQFKARGAEGSVEWLSGLDDLDLTAGNWLVLVRNVFLAQRVVEMCRQEGLYYECFGDSPKRSQAVQGAIAWEELRKGSAVSGVRANIIRQTLTVATRRHIFGFLAKEFEPDALVSAPPGLPIWHEALDKVPRAEKEYLIACLRRGEKLKRNPRIRVSTIHGSKGGECDNVALFTDISARTWRSLHRAPDDEYRVFYVGSTRAKENLKIIQPTGRYYIDI